MARADRVAARRRCSLSVGPGGSSSAASRIISGGIAILSCLKAYLAIDVASNAGSIIIGEVAAGSRNRGLIRLVFRILHYAIPAARKAGLIHTGVNVGCRIQNVGR